MIQTVSEECVTAALQATQWDRLLSTDTQATRPLNSTFLHSEHACIKSLVCQTEFNPSLMGEYIMLITIYFIVGGQCSVHEVHL